MRKLLLRIEVVLLILVLFFSAALILSHSIFPRFGIDIESSVRGASMSPTITEGALIVSKRVPYESLQVGDIINFKAIDHLKATDENGTINQIAVYKENESITHRIISIDNGGIHTKGDNEDPDMFPVDADRYISKVIWWSNHLGWAFRVMYEYKGLLWLIGMTGVLGLVLFIHGMLSDKG